MSHFLLLQYLLYMSPEIGLNFNLTTEHCFLFDSKSNVRACNRVCSQGIPTVDEIKAIKIYFGQKGFTWVTDAENKELHTLLEDNDLKLLLSLPAMKIDLTHIATVEQDPAITIQEISKDWQEIKRWIKIAAESFSRSESEIAIAINCFLQTVTKGHLKLYLGYYNNQPATSLMVLNHNGVITFHWLGTVKELRRKGLGAAVSLHALNEGFLENAQQAVLLSSEHAKKIYEALGFKEYAYYHIYG